ncbi:glycosyltransferase [Planktotalea sp.]|uniref:glycosyltransferase n=1 Tax=Planktotalea sp. TaxID=2029877 RepID=UPI00329815C6
MGDTALKVALLTRQITHYHHPRFVASAQVLQRLDVISVANEGKFSQVLAKTLPDGYRVHRMYETLQDYCAAVKQRSLAAKIEKTLETITPDVVAISGWASPESYVALRWARRRGKGVIVMSDSRAEDAPRNAVRDWIKGRVVCACDAGLAAGESHKGYLMALGLPEGAIRLGYDVVDNAHFQDFEFASEAAALAARANLGLPTSYILASSRFIKKKNLKTLIKAYEHACDGINNPPDLLIAGDGTERAELELLAKNVNSGKVHLPGLFAYKDLPALYALSSGFVHIPTSEQWGLVVSEAAASGLPLLVSKECGAAPELVKPSLNGWLVSAHDMDDIAKSLKSMMTLSKEERRQMGQASQSIVADWGPDRFASGLAETAAMAKTSGKSLSVLDRALIAIMSRMVVEVVA